MLQVGVKALHNVTHIIGDREDTYNWFDPLRVVLKLTIRDLIQYEISFNPLARVAHIRKDGVWEVDHPHSPTLVLIWDSLYKVKAFPNA